MPVLSQATESESTRANGGPRPGPLLGDVSLVDVVAGVDEVAGIVRVLVTHFSGRLNATATATPVITVCGLPTTTKPKASLYVVDGTHSTFWAKWVSDVETKTGKQYGTQTAPNINWFDETAPKAVADHSLSTPGWDWVIPRFPAYRAMTALVAQQTDILVSAQGCATLRPTLAAHAVLLYEIALKSDDDEAIRTVVGMNV